MDGQLVGDDGRLPPPLSVRMQEEGLPRVAEIFALSAAGSAVRPALLAAARALMLEYRDTLLAAGVPIDDMQGFADEIAALPADFVPEARGGLWLALLPAPDAYGSADRHRIVHLGCRGAFRVVGCVGLRDLGGGRCEMKRLYVQPQWRRLGAARALCDTLEAAARGLGYAELLLDSVARFAGALALYTRLGFAPCERYNAPSPCQLSSRLPRRRRLRS